MTLKETLDPEAFPTQTAHKRFLPRVNEHVTSQVTAIGKTLAADGALAGKLVTVVCLHVPAETTPTSQCFVAHHADRCYPSLTTPLVLSILGKCEGVPT